MAQLLLQLWRYMRYKFIQVNFLIKLRRKFALLRHACLKNIRSEFSYLVTSLLRAKVVARQANLRVVAWLASH